MDNQTLWGNVTQKSTFASWEQVLDSALTKCIINHVSNKGSISILNPSHMPQLDHETNWSGI